MLSARGGTALWGGGVNSSSHRHQAAAAGICSSSKERAGLVVLCPVEVEGPMLEMTRARAISGM